MKTENGYPVVMRPTGGEEFDFHCFATAEVTGDVGCSEDRGKYRVEPALHYGVSEDRGCFVLEIKLIDRATSKPVHVIGTMFRSFQDAVAAIASYDPCAHVPRGAVEFKTEVLEQLRGHYRAQKKSWNEEITHRFDVFSVKVSNGPRGDQWAYTVVLEREPDGGYVATVPALLGCVSQGDTRDDALANVREAIDLYLEDCRAAGDHVPAEVELEFVEVTVPKQP